MGTLEEALARTASDAEKAIKAAKDVMSTCKKVHNAASVGNLKDLSKHLSAAEHGIRSLTQRHEETVQGWSLDVNKYLSDGSFVLEVLEAARKADVKVYELDDRLYCYPSLIRLLADQQMVLIDKRKEVRLRPGFLMERLKRHQSSPGRFRPDALLRSLRSAYSTALKTRGAKRRGDGDVVPLAEIYGLLTLLPGQAKEYSRQEFARDLYMLDENPVTGENNGPSLRLHLATGRESDNKVFAIVTKDGDMRRYSGISFDDRT